ncbi:MAG: isoprenyl transferase [Phycisphaera sp.]|nr:isoprenyl transferase [Phycisphaera sp.]
MNKPTDIPTVAQAQAEAATVDVATASSPATPEPARLPRHVAIIMDGNGRWAQQRGEPRVFGHKHGAQVVHPVVTRCAQRGVEALTLYSFSMENWKRPDTEVDFLMSLCRQYLEIERQTMMDNNIQFAHVGRRDGLPQSVLDMLDETVDVTASNTGMTLALALNYGARAELTDAVRAIARDVAAGRLDPDAINEAAIEQHLYTAGLPDPDLLIRTAGEMRVSNFLLWQISYAELWVTDTLWPDFTIDHLERAFESFANRQRRFGAIAPK